MAASAPATGRFQPYWGAKTPAELYGAFGSCLAGKQAPIVYSEVYNLGFWGLEKLHPLDVSKFRKVRDGLVKAGVVPSNAAFAALAECPAEALRLVHTSSYLTSLESPAVAARVAEFPPLAFLPSRVVNHKFLRPNRFHAAGTILAGKLALDHGWAINLGGGMHHAHSDGGGGWCVYTDVVLSYLHLRLAFPQQVKNVMVIDLDVHQGNGHERDKLALAAAAVDADAAASDGGAGGGGSGGAEETAASSSSGGGGRSGGGSGGSGGGGSSGSYAAGGGAGVTAASSSGSGGSGGSSGGGGGGGSVYILDAFRPDIYPGDRRAAAAIDLPVYLRQTDDDTAYLTKVGTALEEAFSRFSPDVCYYVAGTDLLVGDPLGGMSITPDAIVERDEMVWRACREREVPIVYVTAGGYTKPLSAETVTRSLVNLHKKFGLGIPAAEAPGTAAVALKKDK